MKTSTLSQTSWSEKSQNDINHINPSPSNHMQSFTLDQNTLDILATFVANNKIRPTLAGINVTINDDDNTLTLVSTDSYRMHKTIVKKITNTFPNYTPFFVDYSSKSELPYASIEKLIQACKLAIAMDKRKPVITLSNTKVQYGSSYTLNDYHENIPINLSHSDTVKLDANYLLDLLKEIVKIKKQIGSIPSIMMQNESPLSTVLFAFGDHEHIIMPIK